MRDDLIPQVVGEGGSSAADDGNEMFLPKLDVFSGNGGDADDGDEMVLPKLDVFSGNVAAVIVRWYNLVSHAGGTYCLFIFL